MAGWRSLLVEGYGESLGFGFGNEGHIYIGLVVKYGTKYSAR